MISISSHPQELDKLPRVFCLYHNRRPLYSQLVSLVHPIVPILNGLLGLLIHLDALQLHQGNSKLCASSNNLATSPQKGTLVLYQTQKLPLYGKVLYSMHEISKHEGKVCNKRPDRFSDA